MTKIDDNFLLINKPAGWTSFDAVNFVRKKYKQNDSYKPTAKLRVGHAGTLDPFATGLLIVGVGREATKRLNEFKKLPKTYVAVLRLGAVSDTGDPTGEITKSPDVKSGSRPKRRDKFQFPIPNESMIKTVLEKFLGQQLQTPPMFSAKKINGQRLYKLARQGRTVERKPVPIEIYQIKLLDYRWPYLKIEVTCSAGTYIRSLAQDLGQTLGTGAFCEELERTAIGSYTLDRAEKLC